ncbi:hypothetical protein GDO81_008880 [Engystomops pustulosus]|uniref:EGF-like domain-containing protein n=1 Tax=Engystomops pustulosus TaxID=76066 RepID=A0AAV7BMI8_ENGPU|nr:hypothetical protein GDO81_008880 [Engystomops pustulosus]
MRTLWWYPVAIFVVTSPVTGLECLNGGTLIGIKCECLPDFIGPQCEEVVARPGECPPVGGTLIDGVCVCKPGFYGPACAST